MYCLRCHTVKLQRPIMYYNVSSPRWVWLHGGERVHVVGAALSVWSAHRKWGVRFAQGEVHGALSQRRSGGPSVVVLVYDVCSLKQQQLLGHPPKSRRLLTAASRRPPWSATRWWWHWLWISTTNVTGATCATVSLNPRKRPIVVTQ